MTTDKKKPSTGYNLLTRENIEALTMAIIMAVMLKYFFVEAYKIPTGSMQPTLMGNDETGIFDRILVDKFSYHYRDPERFEVAVFKYPLDRSKNFIKRICGMPGEHLMIRDGDLFIRPDETSEWKVLRRPRSVQLEVWKRLNPADPRYGAWKPVESTKDWKVEGRAVVRARGDGAVQLPSDGGSVYDSYFDGYQGDLGAMIRKPNRLKDDNPVGDLRVTGDVTALAGCKAVVVELREGERRHRLTLPGPAAPDDARVRIVSEERSGKGQPIEVTASTPWKLQAGKTVSFAAQNMDDQLQLEVDGEIVLTLDVPAANDQRSCFQLRAEGEGADFTDLQVYRDIYYLGGTLDRSFKIPADSYVMLGDNTQNSSDAREWTFATYRWPGEGSNGQWVRGQNYMGQNPIELPDGNGGTRVFFRDEWGDRHDFPRKDDSRGPGEDVSYVPRHLITGRAVAVFWPTNRLVARFKWIH